MAPPQSTPHRFITPKPKSNANQSSSLHHRRNQTPSTQQFAPTPRFTFGSIPRTKSEAITPATQFSSPLLRRPALYKPQSEDIEDTRSSPELDVDYAATALPIRSPDLKRRRPNPPPASDAILISPSPASSSGTSPPTTPPPQEPAAYFNKDSNLHTPTTTSKDVFSDCIRRPPRPPQFRIPNVTSTHQDDTHTIPARPPLLLPPRSLSPPPLDQSAFFSPSRRGQRYVPGGMAEKVRGWIVEATQHAQVGRKEEWKWRVKVVQIDSKEEQSLGNPVRNQAANAVVLVKDAEGCRWMFIEESRWDRKVKIESVIGVKEPSWEVEIAEQRWRVAVEWHVIEEPGLKGGQDHSTRE